MRPPILYFFPKMMDLPIEWRDKFKGKRYSTANQIYGPPDFNKSTRGFCATPFDCAIDINKDLQDWEQINEDVWLGIDKFDFHPDAFIREEVSGTPVLLGDGNQWLLPSCRVGYEPDLPTHQKLEYVEETTGMKQFEMKTTIYSEYAVLNQFMNIFVEGLFESIFDIEMNQAVTVDDTDIMQAIATAISFNYDIDFIELSRAGVFSESTYLTALKTMMNYDMWFSETLEKLKNVKP